MSNPDKGMKPEIASLKKIAGHINEDDYAKLIDGQVNPDISAQQSKKDVLDKLGRHHSVKSGTKWQIFLYARSRLVNDVTLQGLGDVAQLMIDCIDSLPATRSEREADPKKAKAALQKPMQALANEINKKKILSAFWQKAAFEAGEVQFWAILPSTIDQTTAGIAEKTFHVFDATEAIDAICKKMVVTTSIARHGGQTSHQKVVFRDPDYKQLAEIELRTDKNHWAEIKFWANSTKVLELLQERISETREPRPRVIAYGKVYGLGQD